MPRTRAAAARGRLIAGAARTGAALAGAATVSGVIVGVWAAAAGAAAEGPTPTITVEDGLQIIRMSALSGPEGSRFVPYGEHPGSGSPDHDGGAAPSDSVAFGQELFQGDVPVGTDQVSCTAARTGPGHLCTVRIDFADGTISAHGLDRIEGTGDFFVLDITEGTGNYEDASGTLTVTASGDESPDAFRLAFTAPAFEAAPLVESENGVSTLALYSDLITETYTPPGGEPGPVPRGTDSPRAIGDTISFTHDLLQQGYPVGTDAGGCTRTDEEGTVRCSVTLTFRNGTITVDGPATTRAEGAFTLPIVSGTGDFAGITGTLYSDDAQESDDAVLRLVFS
ncbi:MAG: allene oxide cyclase barrel-like domain-containing protein [Sporichthyaceae bacterium]